MLRKLAVLAASVGVSLLLAPAANATIGPLAVRLEAGHGIHVLPDGTWVGNPYLDYNDFTVRAEDLGKETDEGLFHFVSLPTDQIEVIGYEGDRWECWDVDGGIDCTNPDTVVLGEQWPSLTVQYRSLGKEVQDTLDVYGENETLGKDHFGVAYYLPPKE
jgi:hypothetical protein